MDLPTIVSPCLNEVNLVNSFRAKLIGIQILE